VGIFQYCFIRVFFTIVSVITEALDVYCESSLSPSFAHIWTVVFECLSVTVAMTMVVQFYIQLKDVLADHKPGLKVLSIKLVIFFSFWQNVSCGRYPWVRVVDDLLTLRKDHHFSLVFEERTSTSKR
jgi:hypothetical protein